MTTPAIASPPPRRHKIAMSVTQQIVQDISQHQYPPGTKLASEKDMLIQYGVGRGTLRESLRFLEMNGVITVKPGPGGGPMVADPTAADLASTFGLFLELKQAPFSSVLNARKILEPAIARMAAEKITAIQLDQISGSINNMAGNIEDLNTFLHENERFHDLVTAAAGNPIFQLILGSLEHITDGSRIGIRYPRERRQSVLTAHRNILNALAAHDPERAHREMLSHVEAFERYTHKHYPDTIDSPLRWSDIAP